MAYHDHKWLFDHTLLIFLCLLFVQTLSHAGPSWAKAYGDSYYNELPKSIQQTSDGGYIVAGWSWDFEYSDSFVTKLDSEGKVKWQIHGENGYMTLFDINSVRPTSDEGHICCGYFRNFSTSIGGAFVFKLDSSGNISWQKTYEGGCASSIWGTSDGGYILGGGCGVLRLDSSGNILWQKAFSGLDGNGSVIQQTEDGGYILAGTTRPTDLELENVWIIKLSQTGDFVWGRKLGTSDYDYFTSLCQTADGGYVLTGYTVTITDNSRKSQAWMARLDSSGNLLWQKAFGKANECGLSSIQQTADAKFILAGGTFSYGAGDSDTFVLSLDSFGNILWQNTYGGSDYDSADHIQQTIDGGYVVAGTTNSFGTFVPYKYDLFVMKLDVNGNLDSSCDIASPTSIKSFDSVLVLYDLEAEITATSIVAKDGSLITVPWQATETTICEDLPQVSKVIRASSPFRLKVSGQNFHSDVQVFIGSDTTPWSNVSYKSQELLVLKKGTTLKNNFPKGVPVEIKVVNGDGGSATYTYTR